MRTRWTIAAPTWSLLTAGLLVPAPLLLMGQNQCTQSDADGDDWTTAQGDCDDNDASIYPGATELCDARDNNCDGAVDESGAWWNTNWAYRIPVTLAAPAVDVAGPPVSIDLDFHAALGLLGDSGTFEPDSMRVVVQDCGLGQPELPSQFLDGWRALFEKSPSDDPTGDGAGAVAFRYDTDGDPTTLDAFPASSTLTVAVYFGHNIAAPAYPTSLQTDASGISNHTTAAHFDAAKGGLLSSLTTADSPNLMSQADSCCGNSIYTASTWGIDPQDGEGTLTPLEAGPVVAAIEASGVRSDSSGGYSYSYVYWLFEGRPELWSKVVQVTTADTVSSHSSDFTDGIRPWETVQTSVASSGSAVFTADPALQYADVSDGTWGVSWAYHAPPLYLVNLSMYNPYLIVLGNDFLPPGSGTPVTVPQGTTYMDNIVQFVLPHTGGFHSSAATLTGLAEGVQATSSAPERLLN